MAQATTVPAPAPLTRRKRFWLRALAVLVAL